MSKLGPGLPVAAPPGACLRSGTAPVCAASSSPDSAAHRLFDGSADGVTLVAGGLDGRLRSRMAMFSPVKWLEAGDPLPPRSPQNSIPHPPVPRRRRTFEDLHRIPPDPEVPRSKAKSFRLYWTSTSFRREGLSGGIRLPLLHLNHQPPIVPSGFPGRRCRTPRRPHHVLPLDVGRRWPGGRRRPVLVDVGVLLDVMCPWRGR